MPEWAIEARLVIKCMLIGRLHLIKQFVRQISETPMQATDLRKKCFVNLGGCTASHCANLPHSRPLLVPRGSIHKSFVTEEDHY